MMQKKRDRQEKVWEWVNYVYPCHMSLVYEFPHCNLVATNSLSDTKINEDTEYMQPIQP